MYNQGRPQPTPHEHGGNFNKNPTYGGHVPSATRQPQAYSKPITRQPNAGWIPSNEYQQRRGSTGGPPPPTSSTPEGGLPPMSSSTWNSMALTGNGQGGLERTSGAPGIRMGGMSTIPLEANGKTIMVDIFCKNCRKEANFMCSACKSVHYCSIDCQVK